MSLKIGEELLATVRFYRELNDLAALHPDVDVLHIHNQLVDNRNLVCFPRHLCRESAAPVFSGNVIPFDSTRYRK